jgi:hypothetical protein
VAVNVVLKGARGRWMPLEDTDDGVVQVPPPTPRIPRPTRSLNVSGFVVFGAFQRLDRTRSREMGVGIDPHARHGGVAFVLVTSLEQGGEYRVASGLLIRANRPRTSVAFSTAQCLRPNSKPLV